MSQLREHWEDTSTKVLSRRNQLEDLLADNQQYDTKKREVEAWLARMEGWQQRMAPPGNTKETLEQQLKDQKVFNCRCLLVLNFLSFSVAQSFQNEVRGYRSHIDELNQLTSELIASYPEDDTLKIKSLTEGLNER